MDFFPPETDLNQNDQCKAHYQQAKFPKKNTCPFDFLKFPHFRAKERLMALVNKFRIRENIKVNA